MNLIEKLGGYEEAKKIRVAFDATHYCISRKSQMKMFSVGVIGSTTIAHSMACGFRETKLEDDDLVTQKEIDRALLEFRREHRIFEVGDKVVLAQSYPLDTVNEIKRIENLTPHIKDSETTYFLENSLGCWLFQIKHATDEEIKAGKRLEVNQ